MHTYFVADGQYDAARAHGDAHSHVPKISIKALHGSHCLARKMAAVKAFAFATGHATVGFSPRTGEAVHIIISSMQDMLNASFQARCQGQRQWIACFFVACFLAL